MLYLVLFIIGLVALYFGAEWLVRGGARLARSLGVGPLVVGLTVVAFGTSAPELVVSAFAAAGGTSDVAAGNVVGSNIINIALILGLAAVISPLRVEMRLLAREVPIMIAASIAPLFFAFDGVIGRGEGLMLLAGFGFYLRFVLRAARREPAEIAIEYEEFEAAGAMEPVVARAWRNPALIAIGIVGLVIGARLLVQSSLFFARSAGISELVIGLTIVALGTSLPELATSTVAAFRREADIAVGNVIGSNVFNMLMILGVATTITPFRLDPALVRFDLPVMIGLAVLLVPLALWRFRLGRWEGALLVLGYVAYTWLLLERRA
ncbi:MAG: calcium/sodium antiporter [Gammaproteobacteria bacterium]|nr:calcium/sodium antiporter [Gammaproteobacteria bacterium]